MKKFTTPIYFIPDVIALCCQAHVLLQHVTSIYSLYLHRAYRVWKKRRGITEGDASNNPCGIETHINVYATVMLRPMLSLYPNDINARMRSLGYLV